MTALFRDFALPGSALFAVTLIAYAWTIDWSGAIPRDGTTLAVRRDFLNLWMFGRAAGSADPGQFYELNAYQQAIGDLLGMELMGQNGSYPPPHCNLRLGPITSGADRTGLRGLSVDAALRLARPAPPRTDTIFQG